MITEHLISFPQIDKEIKKTVELFQHAGWHVVGVENLDHNNIRYTIRWRKEKSAPVYPPNTYLQPK